MLLKSVSSKAEAMTADRFGGEGRLAASSLGGRPPALRKTAWEETPTFPSIGKGDIPPAPTGTAHQKNRGIARR